MLGNNGLSELGSVNVITTDFRGLSAEELTDMALAKIISVGESSHPLIAAQATAFKEHIRRVLTHYLELAQRHERANIVGALERQGHTDTANLIRKSF